MVIHMQQKKENDNIMNYDTVRLDDENNAIIIIDQTKLPGLSLIHISEPTRP